MKFRIFLLTVMLFLALVLGGERVLAVVEISGIIGSDTIWTNAESILVTGDVTVAASAELTVQAGTVVYFNPGTGLFIQGQLTADAEGNDRILFTSSADIFGGSPMAGEWKGVKFETGSNGYLRQCDLRYAVNCVDVYMASLAMHQCVIEEFLSKGINVDGYISNPPITPVIAGCVVRQTDVGLLGSGVGIDIGRKVDITISDCFISDCETGLEFWGYGSYTPHFQVTGCDIRDNTDYGIYAHAGG